MLPLNLTKAVQTELGQCRLILISCLLSLLRHSVHHVHDCFGRYDFD